MKKTVRYILNLDAKFWIDAVFTNNAIRVDLSRTDKLLLAVVAVGVRAAAIAVVDGTSRGHVEGAEVVVAGALAVELARAEVDVRGAIAIHPRLGLEAVGTSIAGVEGNRFQDREHDWERRAHRKSALHRAHASLQCMPSA